MSTETNTPSAAGSANTNTSTNTSVSTLNPALLVMTPGVETLAPDQLAQLVWGGAAKKLRALLAQKKQDYKDLQKVNAEYAKKELEDITASWKNANTAALDMLMVGLRSLGQEEGGKLELEVDVSTGYNTVAVRIGTTAQRSQGYRNQAYLLQLNLAGDELLAARCEKYTAQVRSNSKALNELHEEIVQLTQRIAQGKEKMEEVKHDLVLANLTKTHPELVQLLDAAGEQMLAQLMSGQL